MPEETNEVEPVETPTEVETEDSPEEAETSKETQKEAELTPEQKSKLDSFDRLYAENKDLKKKIKTIATAKPPEEVEVWETSNDPLEVVRLGKVLKDYSEQETEFIIRNAPKKNIEGILKSEKDQWVQAAIQSTREKVAKENAAKPSTKQPMSEAPKTLTEKLKSATAEGIMADVRKLADKEKFLEEAGLKNWGSQTRKDTFKLSP